jgi:CHAD domain-containing protein
MAKPKQIRGIDCDATAAAAIRQVLKTRLEEMCALRERALDFSNPEGIHDMRVASRRLRSALRDFSPYVRKRHLLTLLHGIKDLADGLGQVRDQDVAVIALDELASKAPPQVSPGIQAIANIRLTRRDEAVAQLTRILDPDPVAQLQSSFLAALDGALKRTPVKKSSQSAQSSKVLTYRHVARDTILKRLKEFEKLSDSFYHPLKAKPLHKMRIEAKRLRYALELFEQCWGKRIAFLARKVAALQSALGDLHDCDVWIVDFGGDLAEAGKQAATGRDEKPDHSVASLWLLIHFVKLRTKHFRKALQRWREWEAKDTSGELRRTVQADVSAAPITTGKGRITSTKTTGNVSRRQV